ncbi:MAG: cupin domain-containing protein [Acidimicrobiaceae bacterium]|nr:cupin domain-containing protein [Acidimicrobiaceae bacterium]
MDYIRPLDWDHAQVSLDGGYKGQYIYVGESCFIIATKVPPASGGPGRHVHASDQTYYVIDGEIDLSLGAEDVQVPAGSAVFIPAGLPHQNWNRGDVEEVHLEVIAPGVHPAAGPVGRPSDVVDVPGLNPFITAGDPAKRGTDEFTLDWLVNRAKGATNAAIYLAEVPAHKGGPPLHVHEFDQFYFILDGELNVQIGFDHYTVGPDNLVILPARVPHRQWNDGDVAEHHLTIIAPEPLTMDEPWDVAVELAETGERIA